MLTNCRLMLDDSGCSDPSVIDVNIWWIWYWFTNLKFLLSVVRRIGFVMSLPTIFVIPSVIPSFTPMAVRRKTFWRSALSCVLMFFLFPVILCCLWCLLVYRLFLILRSHLVSWYKPFNCRRWARFRRHLPVPSFRRWSLWTVAARGRARSGWWVCLHNFRRSCRLCFYVGVSPTFLSGPLFLPPYGRVRALRRPGWNEVRL